MAIFTSMKLNAAVEQCAVMFAQALDGHGQPQYVISPQQLETAISEGYPMIMRLTETWAAQPGAGKMLAVIRSSFADVAALMRQKHTSKDGRDLGHPYMWILQNDALHPKHSAHVAVIMRHLPWYVSQMDEVVTFLFGKV